MFRRAESSLRISSSWDEPRPCYAICCHWTRNPPSPPPLYDLSSLACDKNFGLFLGSSILLFLARGREGKGSFLMGSWSKWIIARHFFKSLGKGIWSYCIYLTVMSTVKHAVSHCNISSFLKYAQSICNCYQAQMYPSVSMKHWELAQMYRM